MKEMKTIQDSISSSIRS